MKKIIALLMVVAAAQGSIYAAGDWQSIRRGVMLAQDQELQEQARISVRQIIGAVEGFIAVASKKIVQHANEQDKRELQEVVAEVEQVLALCKRVFEENNPDLMSDAQRQELIMHVQMLMVRIAPLIELFSGSTTRLVVDDAFTKSIRVELFTGVQQLVARLKKNVQ